jgi:hypothetical protein
MSETEKELISTIKIAIIRAIALMDEEKLLELVKKAISESEE